MLTTTLIERARSHVHKQQITSLEVPFTGNSDVLYSSSRDKKVYQWRLNPSETERIGILLKEFKGHNHFVTDVQSNKSNSKIMTSSFDKTARIYDVETQKCTILKGHTRDVTGVSVNSDDSMIVTGSSDGSLALWNMDGKLSKVLRLESGTNNPVWINCVSFVPNRNLCVTGSSDGRLRVWDVEKGEIIKTYINGNDMEYYVDNELSIPEANMITALSISADGTFCAYGGRDSVVYIINLIQSVCVLQFETEAHVTSLAFALTETIIAVGTRSSIICWDVISNEKVTAIENDSKTVYCTALTWASTRLIAGYNEGTIVVYDFIKSTQDN